MTRRKTLEQRIYERSDAAVKQWRSLETWARENGRTLTDEDMRGVIGSEVYRAIRGAIAADRRKRGER